MNSDDYELISILYNKCKKSDISDSLFYFIINILKTYNVIELPKNIIKFDDKNNELVIPKIYTNTPVSTPRYNREFSEKKCLGFGAFGCVYLSKNLIDFKDYAVKKIVVANNFFEIKNAMSEIYILSGLQHPNIIRYFNAWVEPVFDMNKNKFFNNDDDICYTTSSSIENDSYEVLPLNNNTDTSNLGFIFYIQTEFCNSNNLSLWLKNRVYINFNINLQYFNSIIDSIEYIHNNNIIHRDIKPSNIFINHNLIKLGDFGLSTFTDMNFLNSSIGTQLYLDPEVSSKNKKCSKKMDIYSLGVILTELFHIFDTDSERIIILNDLKKNIIPNIIFSNYLNIYKIIEKCICSNYNNRYDIYQLKSDFLKINSFDKIESIEI